MESKFMALEKPGKLREFFLLRCGHPARVYFLLYNVSRLYRQLASMTGTQASAAAEIMTAALRGC